MNQVNTLEEILQTLKGFLYLNFNLSQNIANSITGGVARNCKTNLTINNLFL